MGGGGSLNSDNFELGIPLIQKKRFRQKEVYLNTIYDHFGLRSLPSFQKIFSTERGHTLIQSPMILG